mgnify:CR=1 FL=1
MGEWPDGLLREEADSVILSLMVHPASKRAKIEGIDVWRGCLQVAVKAPPRKGAANEAVCELLAEAFEIPLVFVEIMAGDRSRQKSVRLREITLQNVKTKLEVFHAK